ncbi:MAG: glycosyltransferase N-terminal domain-containing protein [Bacteroidota bacterium]|jgi:3-deoxy-D-manno-octulosonic-acid transferase
MHFLYTFSLRLYYLALWIASWFNPRAKAWISGRKGWKQDLRDKIEKIRDESNDLTSLTSERSERPHEIIWFHCASLGEFEQGRPLIEDLLKRYPKYKIIVSFFSPSGYAIRSNYKYADAVVYLPLDTVANAKFWVDTVRPKAAFFIKYEYWFNFLSELKQRGIPAVFVSAVFRQETLFFQWYAGWFRAQLENIHWFFVQNETSGKLIQSLGFENVTISGDTRFDRVSATAADAGQFPLVKKFCGDARIIMGGSTWPEDEALLIPLTRSNDATIRYILATHDVSEPRIRSLEHSLGMPSVRYSNLNEENAESARVLIIDTIGILSQLYQYADLAYIGGAFGAGLHNILEAVVFGLPVFFGPRHEKFWEAEALIEKGGAFMVRTADEFSGIALRLLSDKAKYKQVSAACFDFISEHRGATALIMEGTASLLNS